MEKFAWQFLQKLRHAGLVEQASFADEVTLAAAGESSKATKAEKELQKKANAQLVVKGEAFEFSDFSKTAMMQLECIIGQMQAYVEGVEDTYSVSGSVQGKMTEAEEVAKAALLAVLEKADKAIQVEQLKMLTTIGSVVVENH